MAANAAEIATLVGVALSIAAQIYLGLRLRAQEKELAFQNIEHQRSLEQMRIDFQKEVNSKQLEIQEAIANRQVLMQESIAKRQIAESIGSKRQIWINELRSELAEVMSALIDVLDHIQDPNPDRSYRDELHLKNQKCQRLIDTIKMRMNPNQAEHAKLIDLLTRMTQLAEKNVNGLPHQAILKHLDDFRAAHLDLISHASVYLKSEWDRIKSDIEAAGVKP